MSSKCPKCGKSIKPSYLKQTCPACGVNMFYYKFDEQLEEDAKKAQSEVDAVNRFFNVLKSSTIKTPWHIVRMILFFMPLASMCLPMFYAGHKNVSLITLIMSIINHGLDMGAIVSDKSYLFAVLSVLLVIVLSIAEIISSLFSATENGFKRNICFFSINFLVLFVLSVLVIVCGGYAKIGLFVTLLIYIIKLILHCVLDGKVKRKAIIASVLILALIPCSMLAHGLMHKKSEISFSVEKSDVGVVSFNVASAFGTGLEDTDSMVRCQRFAEYMKAVRPDFIGTQEMNSYWMNQLKASMSDYEGYGVKRGGDSEEKNSEMNSVFWLADKYDAVVTNTIWLSQTPDTESKYTYIDADGQEAEAGCNRVCSYAVLKSISDNRLFAFMNTHLDNASEEARVFGAKVILSEIDKIQAEYKDIRIILTGDFNETADDEAVRLLSSKLNHANSESVNCATYQEWGYRNTGDMPIDFIFTNQDAKNYTVLDNTENGYVSDHYGIYTGINLK